MYLGTISGEPCVNLAIIVMAVDNFGKWSGLVSLLDRYRPGIPVRQSNQVFSWIFHKSDKLRRIHFKFYHLIPMMFSCKKKAIRSLHTAVQKNIFDL